MKNLLFWAIAVVITLSSAIYQRTTGPTTPVRGSHEVSGEEISFRLIRTYVRPGDAPVRVEVESEDTGGFFRYRRYPSHDTWDTIPLLREDNFLVAYIPGQPAAGKVMYQIFLSSDSKPEPLTEDPVIIRFRDDVPAWAMLPHIILMFAAMLFSTRAGLAAIFRDKTRRLTLITGISFIAGGIVFGPIVQKYAFGDYWTGWPLGTDLTDNKTAFSLIFWIVAIIKTSKNEYHRSWVITAAVVLLLIYLIPHSMFGSEIDWTQEQP